MCYTSFINSPLEKDNIVLSECHLKIALVPLLILAAVLFTTIIVLELK